MGFAPSLINYSMQMVTQQILRECANGKKNTVENWASAKHWQIKIATLPFVQNPHTLFCVQAKLMHCIEDWNHEQRAAKLRVLTKGIYSRKHSNFTKYIMKHLQICSAWKMPCKYWIIFPATAILHVIYKIHKKIHFQTNLESKLVLLPWDFWLLGFFLPTVYFKRLRYSK